MARPKSSGGGIVMLLVIGVIIYVFRAQLLTTLQTITSAASSPSTPKPTSGGLFVAGPHEKPPLLPQGNFGLTVPPDLDPGAVFLRPFGDVPGGVGGGGGGGIPQPGFLDAQSFFRSNLGL